MADKKNGFDELFKAQNAKRAALGLAPIKKPRRLGMSLDEMKAKLLRLFRRDRNKKRKRKIHYKTD